MAKRKPRILQSIKLTQPNVVNEAPQNKNVEPFGLKPADIRIAASNTFYKASRNRVVAKLLSGFEIPSIDSESYEQRQESEQIRTLKSFDSLEDSPISG